jgi:hypothetical protein
MLQCFATMTIIFTITSVHGEIDGKFARTQPTILTNACCNLLQQWPLHSLSMVCVLWDQWEILTIGRWWDLPKRHSNYGYIYTTLLSFIILYHHVFSKKSSTFAIGVGEVCCHIPSQISLLWVNNSTKKPPHFGSWKILRQVTMVVWGC